MPEELFGFKIMPAAGAPGLVLEPLEGAELINYQVAMITGNSIPGLLEANMRCRENRLTVYYDIEGYVPLGVYLKKQGISRDQFLLLAKHLKNIFRESRKYLLSPGSFILAEKFIYVKEELNEIALLYIPGKVSQDIDVSIRDLLIRIMGRSEDAGEPDMASFTENIKMGAVGINNLDTFIKEFFIQDKVFKKLSAPGTGSLRSYSGGSGLALHPSSDSGAGRDAGRLEAGGPITGKSAGSYITWAVAAVVLAAAALSATGQKAAGLQAVSVMLLSLGSAGAVLYVYLKTRQTADPAKKNSDASGAGAADSSPQEAGSVVIPRSTQALGGFFVPVVYKKAGKKKNSFAEKRLEPGKGAALLRIVKEGKEEAIELDKKEFFIGRNKAVADYGEIADQGVEPLHAKILKRDEEYSIVDLDSESGTYINGQRIESSRPYLIRHRDVIALAGLEFVFEEG